MSRRTVQRVWLFGLLLSLGLGLGAGRGQAQIRPADAPVPVKPAAAPAPAAAVPELDFVSTLREMRLALHEVSDGREAAKKRGDKLKEACIYERQRAIAQAVDSTEAAQVGWEAATRRGDVARSREEQDRALRAVELVRQLRLAAEACIGEELRGASQPTKVTVNGPGKLDDPKAGPVEAAVANTVRLEIPSRPNPASAFRPTR